MGPNNYAADPVMGQLEPQPTVTLYRGVDGAEFSSIANEGIWNIPTTASSATNGKYFTSEASAADQWGAFMNKNDGLTLQSTAPSSVLTHPGVAYLGPRHDGIGPAYFFDTEAVRNLNSQMDGISLVD
ncbi:hypothetical protein AAU01_22290 [Paenarthrobacter aurescens]|uniref:Uncharacterized protein n=1 Tax=Paenarthrobacter aurescens TaxID=43663 RepID=A0A4Y3NC04_PAEAU|nr:hypothetical protein AAU01_22290 [Paenarthrobacter aurescens]